MKIPCMTRLPFIIYGLSFLRTEHTRIRSDNLMLIATALMLGARSDLSEISRMWLKEKCAGTLSYFMSEARFPTYGMRRLFMLRVLHLYKLGSGCFLTDDTMRHHTRFCKRIHGVFVLSDHALLPEEAAIAPRCALSKHGFCRHTNPRFVFCTDTRLVLRKSRYLQLLTVS